MMSKAKNEASDNAVFSALLCDNFTPTKKSQRLYELAKQYHKETEAYNQRVCSGRTERGVAIPVDSYEFRLINRNALKALTRLLDENPGINRQELHRAISVSASLMEYSRLW